MIRLERCALWLGGRERLIAEGIVLLTRREPTLRFGADVVPHVFGFLVLGETGRAELPAEAALFEPAPFRLGNIRVVVVDPDRSVTKARGHPLRAAGVLSPHRAGEAIDGVVGDADRLVFCLLCRGSGESFDREDRTEGLFLDAGHLGAAVTEDRRQVEIPVVERGAFGALDRKSTRLNSSHVAISYAVFCLKK